MTHIIPLPPYGFAAYTLEPGPYGWRAQQVYDQDEALRRRQTGMTRIERPTAAVQAEVSAALTPSPIEFG